MTIAELFPIASRLELESGKWVPRYFPPNLGGPRDIPRDAVVNPSVWEMLKTGALDKSMTPVQGGTGFWQNLKYLFGSRKTSAAAPPSQRNVHGHAATNGVADA